MEEMKEVLGKQQQLEGMVDGTSFGIVKQHLLNEKSPIKHLFCVEGDQPLTQIADILSSPDQDAVKTLFERGFLQVVTDDSAILGSGAVQARRMSDISEDAFVRAIFLPPIYLMKFEDEKCQ